MPLRTSDVTILLLADVIAPSTKVASSCVESSGRWGAMQRNFTLDPSRVTWTSLRSPRVADRSFPRISGASLAGNFDERYFPYQDPVSLQVLIMSSLSVAYSLVIM